MSSQRSKSMVGGREDEGGREVEVVAELDEREVVVVGSGCCCCCCCCFKKERSCCSPL